MMNTFGLRATAVFLTMVVINQEAICRPRLEDEEFETFFDMLEHYVQSDLGILAFADTDKDEKVTLEELKIYSEIKTSVEEPMTSEEVTSWFKQLDKNEDGFITADEVKGDGPGETLAKSFNT